MVPREPVPEKKPLKKMKTKPKAQPEPQPQPQGWSERPHRQEYLKEQQKPKGKPPKKKKPGKGYKTAMRKVASLCKRIGQLNMLFALGLVVAILGTTIISLVMGNQGLMCCTFWVCSTVYIGGGLLAALGFLLGLIVWLMTFRVQDLKTDKDLYWGVALNIGSLFMYGLATVVYFLPLALG